ncbi:MAG: hypothetical protein AAF281_03995 [Pseudomonadota bacterium]
MQKDNGEALRPGKDEALGQRFRIVTKESGGRETPAQWIATTANGHRVCDHECGAVSFFGQVPRREDAGGDDRSGLVPDRNAVRVTQHRLERRQYRGAETAFTAQQSERCPAVAQEPAPVVAEHRLRERRDLPLDGHEHGNDGGLGFRAERNGQARPRNQTVRVVKRHHQAFASASARSGVNDRFIADYPPFFVRDGRHFSASHLLLDDVDRT